MRMKRIFAVLLAALFVVSMLAGCSKSGPEGKYVVKSMGGVPVDEYFDSMIAEYGEGMTKESLLNELGISKPEEFMTFELKSDKTLIVTLAGEEPQTGTWKADGDQIVFTIGDEILSFRLKNNEFAVNEDGQSYVFVKK